MSNEITNQTKHDTEISEPANLSKVVASVSHREIFAGPLPHPDLFKTYNEILPGSADRILTSFENEQKHGMIMNLKIINYDQFYRILGMACALILCVYILYICQQAIEKDYPVEAFSVIGALIISVVGSFIWKQHRENKKENQKEDSTIE